MAGQGQKGNGGRTDSVYLSVHRTRAGVTSSASFDISFDRKECLDEAASLASVLADGSYLTLSIYVGGDPVNGERIAWSIDVTSKVRAIATKHVRRAQDERIRIRREAA